MDQAISKKAVINSAVLDGIHDMVVLALIEIREAIENLADRKDPCTSGLNQSLLEIRDAIIAQTARLGGDKLMTRQFEYQFQAAMDTVKAIAARMAMIDEIKTRLEATIIAVKFAGDTAIETAERLGRLEVKVKIDIDAKD